MKETMLTPHYLTVQDAVQGLKERGFTDNLELAGNVLRAVGSGRSYTATELTIIEHHRFEGASDPDDMAVVYGILSDDGMRGIVVDAYGVYADPRLSEFLTNVKIREEQ